MTTSKLSLGVVLTAHGEGAMAAVSYNSLLEACQYAEERDIEVKKMVVLDKPSAQTSVIFEGLGDDTTILETNFGDQGLVRNAAVESSDCDLIAFLDGDDLWGENWLYEAHTFLSKQDEKTIAHPEFNWFFQGVSSVLIGLDQDDPKFNTDFLRFGNYWDAMCMAYRSAHLAIPYCERKIKEGFAFEDWHWNCETVWKGFNHKIVNDTIHFKRRRQNSQTLEASGTKSLMPATEITSFANLESFSTAA